MIYKKSAGKELDMQLFASPTSEYRGTPFWAWNNALEKDDLLWQIEQLKKMGFGGFHIHCRSGLTTTYLGKEYMDLVKACNEKAKSEQMLTWLYDEDRWPSGFAGGYVTKDPRHRQKFLLFTVTPKEDAVDAKTGYETGKPYLLAVYDVCLGSDETLSAYQKIDERDAAQGTKWYVYVCTSPTTERYNNQSYVDTMSKAAIDQFIQSTYEAYASAVGDDFGKSVYSIFTDEPQMRPKRQLPSATAKNDIELPYTTDFAETFRAAYGIDLLAHLPELLWDLPDGKPSRVRYLYHDHTAERFTQAFSDQCGKWCQEHGIYLTGHVMEEDTLQSQTVAVGEAMRAYRSFGIPGIDLLCDAILLPTAKQCQSAVHQYGREGMLSELYGVTGWDFDFRGHKFQGDWQAALGVTVRVPHLSWVSMKGAAKRDYPASINYQSAWYREYPYIEDHFARLNTVLTRGKPFVKVAVLHPIETCWLHFGPQKTSSAFCGELQKNFASVTNWLLFGTVDFDYISEALLPSQYGGCEDGSLRVGEMAYTAVVVPGLETVRSSTLRILKDFQAAGGKIIFMGESPKYVDACISDAAKELYQTADRVPFSSVALLNALAEEREVGIREVNGVSTDNLIYQMREDGDCRWLFVAHAKKWEGPGQRGHMDPPAQNLLITVKGLYVPTVYDTVTGKIYPASYETVNGNTVVKADLYRFDSLLLRLDKNQEATASSVACTPARRAVGCIHFSEKADYSLSEPNVMVLDMAQLSEDGVHYGKREEMLRLDSALRKKLNFPLADGRGVQPWLIEEEKIEHFPYLRFVFDSEVEAPCRFASEEVTEVIFNGKKIPVVRDGYFTDRSIATMPLGKLCIGQNELIVRMPFGKRVSLENCFLLGDFGVRVEGCHATVIEQPKQLAFGSVVHQGLPFYGANITYKTEFELEEPADVAIRAEMYKGALISVRLDGEELGKIVFSPYKLCKNNLPAGKHCLELTLFGTRVNCFNALHNTSGSAWINPTFWYSSGVDWAYEYQLKELGILKSPVIELYNPTKF